MNTMRFLPSLSIILISISAAHAEPPCAEWQNYPTTLASASTWTNLRNSEDSIKFKIGNLLKEGIGSSSSTKFSIKSTPNKLLDNYSDKTYCETKKQETENSPLQFNSPEIPSLDNLNSWIADFSQGKGEKGGELYEKCDRSCSPSYEYHISYRKEQGEKINVTASVVCGHARDKDDNQYTLSLRKCKN